MQLQHASFVTRLVMKVQGNTTALVLVLYTLRQRGDVAEYEVYSRQACTRHHDCDGNLSEWKDHQCLREKSERGSVEYSNRCVSALGTVQ